MALAATGVRCSDPRFDSYVTPYCFADLSGQEREDFELHLLSCEACWSEVDRLSKAVALVKASPKLVDRLRTPEVVGQFGMSGHLEQPFGGHRAFTLVLASLYGLLHVASVWTELSYSYDRFGNLIWGSSVFAFAAATIGAALALWLAARGAAAGSDRNLGMATLALVGVLTLMTAAMWQLLPQVPTIDANFATRSAAAGFLKNEILYFAPLLLFILPTFHAVVALQAQLRAGRFRAVLDLLTGSREGVPPRGVWLIPSWFLMIILMTAAVIGYLGTNNLLDNLKTGTYSNTFTAALYMRVFLWYVIAVLCFAWYHRSIQELKREAIAASRLIDSR